MAMQPCIPLYKSEINFTTCEATYTPIQPLPAKSERVKFAAGEPLVLDYKVEDTVSVVSEVVRQRFGAGARRRSTPIRKFTPGDVVSEKDARGAK